MKNSRLSILSIIYNFKEHLHDEGFNTVAGLEGASTIPFIRVSAKDQAYSDWSVPCVVIYPSAGSDSELQLGGGYWINQHVNFDIYAKTDSQLLDLVDYVMGFVEHNSYLYRYDLNAPTYQVLEGKVRTLYEAGIPENVCHMYFENRTVTFMDRVDTIGEARAHAAQVRTVVSTPNMQ